MLVTVSDLESPFINRICQLCDLAGCGVVTSNTGGQTHTIHSIRKQLGNDISKYSLTIVTTH